MSKRISKMKQRKKKPAKAGVKNEKVPRPGFEPRLTGPEPVVLPLNDRGIYL